jgi:hypothetical protein
MTQQISEGGLRFPAIVLFSDGQRYWLAGAFHRVLAAREARNAGRLQPACKLCGGRGVMETRCCPGG